MNKLLWGLQGLLALVFLAHGILFLFPPPDIAVQMNATLPRWFQLFLGVAEVLAAIGLTMPGMTRIQPWLVPAAAGGVMIVCLSATVMHVVRAEYSSAGITAVLLLLSTVVTLWRWKRLPIAARGAE
jgi:DoxX-like family